MMYFSEKEFSCQCGCGTNNVSRELKDKLDAARAIAGVSFVIDRRSGSACRCVKHNKSVGGSESSSHIATETIECTAVDIEYRTSHQCYKILFALYEAGFTRIGINNGSIHADVDTTKPLEVVWNYYK